MTKILLAVLFAALIIYVIGRIKRYRAWKRDDALNALYPHPKPHVREIAEIKNESKEISSKIGTCFRYVGRYEDMTEPPKIGDVTYMNGEFYVYNNGWIIIG